MNIRDRRVLIFGDSLSHRGGTASPNVVEVRESSGRNSSPGDLLASRLLEAGASAARLNAKVGRSAYSFFKSEQSNALIAADRFWLGNDGVVIIMLGTNDLGFSPAANQAAFARLCDAFAGYEIWVVGPPSFARQDLMSKTDAVVATQRTVFGEGRVLDSRPLTSDLTEANVTRTSDGVHFTTSGSRTWAERTSKALLSQADDAPQIDQPQLVGFSPVFISLAASAVVLLGALLIASR